MLCNRVDAVGGNVADGNPVCFAVRNVYVVKASGTGGNEFETGEARKNLGIEFGVNKG